MPESGNNVSSWQWFRLVLLIALAIFVIISVQGMPENKKPVVITGTELYAAINEGRVKEIGIYESGKIVGVFTNGDIFESSVIGITELEKAAVAKGVPYKVIKPSMLEQFLWGILPWILMIFLFYYFFLRPIGKQAGGGPGSAFDFGKSKIKFIDPKKIEVTLADVGGCDEVKEEFEDILDFLENPQPYIEMKAKPPHGILLIGPPGCGKTRLAKAMAKEVGVPFGYLSGSDFVQMFVGVGAARVRDTFAQVFQQALHYGTCILFIDEIDAIGKRRHAGFSGGHDEQEQSLNALLAEMDGFASHSGVIVIGATNRPEVLDEALLRPGRFDRKVTMPLPDINGREEILRIHSRDAPMESDIDLKEIARATVMFSGADLENIIKEAKIFAIRREHKKITRDDMRDALDKEIGGPERKLARHQDEKKKTAYHEAGHVLGVKYTDGAEPLYKVTILPRGDSGGGTYQLPERDRYLSTRQQLFAQIVVCMGGRAAEMMEYNQESTGAMSDFQKATQIATAMVCEFGMSDKIGKAVYAKQVNYWGEGAVNCSPETRRLIDEEIKKLLDQAYDEVMRILKEHRVELDAIAKALIEKEKLTAPEIDEIIQNCKSAS